MKRAIPEQGKVYTKLYIIMFDFNVTDTIDC